MSALPPVPPARSPERPHNALHTVADAINAVVSLPMQAVNVLNEGFASATNVIAQALPEFPAATLTSAALGINHAHILHPPSGPPPIPPTPMPVFGAVLLGTSVQVLIGGLPAARCGDLGFNPTCCGLPPIFEIFTGSSKVFIAGARAARMTDITYHCKPVPSAGAAARGAALALQIAAKAAQKASMVAQVAAIAGDGVEAVAANSAGDGDMASAMALSAGMAAAQMAADAVATAMSAAMGKDICVPPGTLGAILDGSPNVVIGGFPMPSWTNVAKGLLRLVRGLKQRMSGKFGRGECGC